VCFEYDVEVEGVVVFVEEVLGCVDFGVELGYAVVVEL